VTCAYFNGIVANPDTTTPLTRAQADERARRDALRDLARPSYREHDRRLQRLVAAYRSRHATFDGLPAGFLPLEDLRLDVLTYRWGDGALGGPRPRAPLATYRAVADGHGLARVRFARIRVRDAASRRAMAARPDDARIALALHHAARAARPDDWVEALPLPRFYAAFDPRALTPAPTRDAAEVDIDGLSAWPLEDIDLGLDPGGCPPRGTPLAVYAHLEHLRGRSAHNPAADVLVYHGLLPARPRAGGRPDDRDVDRFHQALETHIAADPGRHLQLRRELARACDVHGIPLPGGPRGELATDLLVDPWRPIPRPGAGRPLLVRLAGPPGPGTAVFATDTVAADLADLGIDAAALDGCPRPGPRRHRRQ
jgi:hypothetical protein